MKYLAMLLLCIGFVLPWALYFLGPATPSPTPARSVYYCVRPWGGSPCHNLDLSDPDQIMVWWQEGRDV